MTALPDRSDERHLRLVWSQDEPELETPPSLNWGCLGAVAASLLVWTLLVAAGVFFLA